MYMVLKKTIMILNEILKNQIYSLNTFDLQILTIYQTCVFVSTASVKFIVKDLR